MSHRRSSSLTGGARVSEEQVPSAKARTRPAPPLKASSFDYGDHGAPGGPGIEGEDGMRRGRPENLAQAAMSVAHSTYEALENRSEAIMQRFDDSIDELENGPLVQTAKATVQKVATVIEKPVGLIKQSRFVEEVSGVLTEIENTEVVQVARGRARQAYMYVEPISEKILSRVGSFDADEDENVQFVIPPSMQRSPGRVVDVPLKPRPLLRPYEIEGQRVKLDPTQYAIQEEVPEIHVSGEDGRLSVLSQGSDKLLKVKAPDQISIVSATDSERQYELVRPHRLYRTPPLPPPRHKEPRRSLQARLSNNGVKTSLVEESSERRQDGEEGLCRCGSSARSVRFTEKDSTSKKDGAAGASKGSGKEPSSSTLTVKRMVDVEERRPAIKDQQYMESVDKRNSLLDECTEDQPLVPIEMEGCSISKIREKLREYNYSVICINGKTFYVPKSIVKEPEPREVYGGASTFFEASETIDWKTVKDASGQPAPSKEKPRWMQQISTGLENFLSNAHDPWLSEADRDPLACDSCCTCFDNALGWDKKKGPKFPLQQKNETFCVVSKRFRKNYVHRFSASKSLFLFSPWHPLRRAAIFLSTNQFFDYLVMATILLNCVFLAMTETVPEAEYMFLAIYSAEMMIKTVAKGFILNKYTYLRNPWNWLDFVVIASGYVTLVIELGDMDVQLGNLAGLRTFRVLRALKTVSIMPGLKTIINALLNSIKQLVEVMTLTVFCLMVFALFALQVYMGVLKNKCVKTIVGNVTSEEWTLWRDNSSHWFYENGTNHPDIGFPRLCGNATGARKCPEGYSCLPDVGDNPNFGFTNFDNFLWSMLTTFQLITLDFWEDVYNKVIATGGPLQVVFFAIVVFFGSFYLINLMLAVVAMSYEEEAENTEEEKTKDLMDHRDDSTFSFDPEKLTHARPLEKKKPKNRRVIVMRRGAGILSDKFSKKKKKKDEEEGEDKRKGSASSEGTTSRQPSAPSNTPRLGSSQLDMSAGHHSLSRPASLVTTPLPSSSPAPTQPLHTPPSGRCQSSQGASVEGVPARTGASSSCDPCNASSTASCCTCHCHTRQQQVAVAPPGLVALRGGCDDPRPHLRLANNPAHRQPSLDDSGVVGDHEGGDSISIHHLPHAPQVELVGKAEQALYARRKCNGVSPSSPAALSASSQHIVMVEDELVDRNCEKCHDCCVNYRVWLKFQNLLYIVVHDAIFDLFIMVCIIMNTAFLAIEHHGMSYELNRVLEVGNRVFTAVFTLECIMKIMALSREFFINRWNVFDLVIVLASLLDLGLEIGSGLSVLRGMRLLRVLKLAQSWRTMRVLLSIIVSTLGALGNLTFVLLIIIYIFAVIGMQLFGKNYTAANFHPDPIPRWNFTDFFHSFMMIFRILCGEWVEPLWDCMRAEKNDGSETCLAIFLPALVMGNFMVLNLFLALLLNSFNSEELKSRQDDLEDESRILQLFVRLRDNIFRRKKRKTEELDENDTAKDEEDAMPDRGVKKAFSEPEMHARCEEEAGGDPQMKGYKRMTVVDQSNYKTVLARAPQENGHMDKNVVNGKKVKFQGDDDRPEIIELSEFNQGDEQFAFCQPRKSMQQEYRGQQYQEYTPSDQPPEEYSTGEYQQGYSNEYGHEHDYHQLQFPESEGEGGNNEDSVSEVNLSDGNIPKMKLEETVSFRSQAKEGYGRPNGGPKGKHWQRVKKEIPTPFNKTQSWSAVVNYVDTITSGVKDDDDPRFKRQEIMEKEPADCFPKKIFNSVRCCAFFTETRLYKKWYRVRQMCLYVVDSPYFEWVVLILIFASSVTLCFEDIHLDSKRELKEVLNYLNLVFAILFTIEMFVKWIALGFVKYFSSVWTILDCFIVLVSMCSLFIEQDNLIALRSLRTLRALRPLRAISRWEGMKIVVNALMYAIPSIFNVLLVCLVFWLIFSIMGVQMFGGKFYKCIDHHGEILPLKIVENKTDCLAKNYSWVNSKINFDHVGFAYLALFQVATFEGWMEVMEDAVDCRGIDKQPEREANIYAYIYFVIFIVCGSFFTLNLFIGVIIDNFNALKKKYEGGVLEMFLTDSQKNYYTAMKKLGRKKPQKVIRRPKHPYHALFYDIAVSRRFEISIFVLIFLNMVTMAIEHYHQSRTVAFTLEVFNALFTTIFGLEAIVKIIGLRHHYFTVPWNLFDFILVFASIMGILLQDVLTNFPISPTLLRVVRVFRIGRILRLIKPTVNGRNSFFGQAAKGIRKLLFALIVSLPALFNIGALLFLITFIYAIIGMAVFGHVQRKGALDDLVNFETFGSSMMLLFRLITSAGWNDVLDPLMAKPPDCDINYMNQPNGNCGHPVIAIVFFVSFIIINFMIVINMYIAVILENFNQAHKEEEIGIVEDDLEMFYVRWSKYDPHATQFINFSQLSDFIASLDSPFGIPKPNTVALVAFDLPIAKGDKIHCLDILHALTKHVLGHVEETEEFKRFPPQLKMQMEEKFKKQFPTRKELEIVSSTRRWKKMDSAAKTIQQAWRAFLKHRRELEKKNLLLEEAQTQTSSPGGSSIKSGFRRVSNLLQVVPMPMSVPRRRSVTVLQVDGGGSSSRRASRASINETSTSPRGSFFFPISRRASRASATSATSGASNPSLVSVQIHQVGGHDSPHASQGSTEALNTEAS
ncbi:sodium channel protein 60E-like isoform X5 [Portunus trituberculatus]|uniref:sodium channel protein 60E-like isoform X5 n=1 Tax=Portunus trituberculatus TaxID=210409 RepID=UPI001E1CCF88|nr:sodium channel protein 60E-like isoform X5 [Portunus trituberculatus]